MGDGSVCSVVNTYLPPTNNLGRRNLTEHMVRDAFSDILGRVLHDSKLIVAGDLNARTGTCTPSSHDFPHPPRTSADSTVCPRGSWLVEQCALFTLTFLNGTFGTASGDFTCIRHNGASVCDYLLVRGQATNFTVNGNVLGVLSDHRLLHCTLPWVPSRAQQATAPPTTVYRWVDGTSLSDYAVSWQKWRSHTDSQDFAVQFQTILDTWQGDIDALSDKVENFLLTEALARNVVKRVDLKPAANPNRHTKCLAPWFGESCKEAKLAYRACSRQHGRTSLQASLALKKFTAACDKARKQFGASLPSQLKYEPRAFWRHVLSKSSANAALAPETFATHLGNLFHDPAAGPEAHHLAPISDFEAITPEEVGDVLEHHYNGSVSSGMSTLPSQVIKHLSGDALKPTSAFLNLCTKAGRPPTAWNKLKLVPLYKLRGDQLDPDNYRALAVGHPMAKLAMAIITRRVNKLAEDNNLRAPTQAGFRAGYTTEDLGLVLQTAIQSANINAEPLGIIFIDLKKAYDSIDRWKLWEVLAEELAIPGDIVKVL